MGPDELLRLFGPASAQQWQELKSGIIADGTRRWFRVRGGLLLIHPTPTVTGDTIAYDYVSNGWCQSAASVVATAGRRTSTPGCSTKNSCRWGLFGAG